MGEGTHPFSERGWGLALSSSPPSCEDPTATNLLTPFLKALNYSPQPTRPSRPSPDLTLQSPFSSCLTLFPPPVHSLRHSQCMVVPPPPSPLLFFLHLRNASLWIPQLSPPLRGLLGMPSGRLRGNLPLSLSAPSVVYLAPAIVLCLTDLALSLSFGRSLRGSRLPFIPTELMPATQQKLKEWGWMVTDTIYLYF